MASLFSASLNPTSDLSKPETDLAEWTSKIKALQKQVDADEEAEQKRLEDEIVAARQARLRRRSGMDSESRFTTMDIPNNKDDLNIPTSAKDNALNRFDNSGAEQQIDRNTALRKLMGTNDVYNPDKVSAPVRAATEKPESTSLATFIGGRASGPRLNRHAPQQDAHDPTQFVQPDTSHPHPIFGRGGIAMPGMADKKGSNVHGSSAGSESSERYRPSFTTKPKSPSSPTVYVPSKTETNNLSSVDVSRRSFIGPSKVAERYGAKVEESPIDLGTELPQPSRPSFRTTKSTSSAPLTKDSGQNQEPYFRSSNFSNRPPDHSLSSNVSNLISESPPISVSTAFSSTGPSKAGSSNKPDIYISAIPVAPKSALLFVGTQSPVNPRTIRADSPERARDTPLRKLMDINNVHNPDKATAQASQKSEASSLAAFIGGRAAGPRLNRHAPQQDVHDPTQFIQSDLSIPHPIFGKGGIAMPGMATKPSTPLNKMVGVESSFSKSRLPSGHDGKASSQERRTGASSSKGLESISKSHSARGGTSSFTSSPFVNRSPSPVKEFGARTSTRDRTISTPSYSHSVRTSHEQSRSSMSPTPSRSSNSTLGLAQPTRPDIKAPSILSQIPSTTMPSPAFQRPLSQKDPTPSISRLQGRGFVQSMVKVSAELETSSPTTPSPGASRLTSGRKNAVLDRWQPSTQADTSPMRPTPSCPDVMRRLTTFNTMNITSDNPNIFTHATGTSRTLKSVASLPSLSKAATPGEIDSASYEPTRVDENLVHDKPPGLGSASTMVVIKPSKSSDFNQKLRLDELGMKNDPTNFFRQDKGSHFSPHSEKATSSRKALIHPTKDRARRPKKSKDAIDTMKDLLPAVDALCPGPAETDSSVVANVAAVNSVASQTGNGKSSPSVALADHSEVSSASSKWDDLPSTSQTLAPSLKQHAESENPQHHTSYHLRLPCMMPPSEDNAAEAEHPQNGSFISPHPSFTPPLESPSQLSSSTALPVNAAKVPHSPRRHSRIPSTGSRITVMEVSQSLNDVAISRDPMESCASPIDSAHESVSPVEFNSNSRHTLSQTQAEKRKSSYEKYSAIILPPLKEEATPTQTPIGTLTRINANQRRLSIEVEMRGDVNSGRSNDDTGSLIAAQTKDVVYLDHSDKAIPQVDLTDLLKTRSRTSKPSPDIQTVSIEVLAITGTTATPVLRDIDVFYDSEILAIVHRTKSKLSGLASTSVWCWLGKRTILADREDKKLQELATRYGTTRVIVYQLAEPYELVQILGGRLAIRQGTRTHWTPENTTMHLVRSLNDVIFIDEHDLSMKNLCSAFSYCVTILDSVYVWYGRGSVPPERKAALQYAEAMTNGSVPPIELYEGENDNDEMFWMILGGDGFAQADYWRWRTTFANIEPSIWKVDFGNGASFMRPVEFFSLEQDHHTSVYLVDCVWEFFVLVCENARSNRQAIRLALDIAMKLSKEVASTRPYVPTVHTLILPSQIPLDLLLNIRDLDEAWLNRGNIPDHMNLLPYSEAIDHLSKYVWERAALKDHDMLPLGVGVSDAMRLPQVCL